MTSSMVIVSKRIRLGALQKAGKNADKSLYGPCRKLVSFFELC